MAAENVKPLGTETKEKLRQVKPGQLYVFGKIQAVEKFQNRAREIRFRTRVLMKDMTDDFSYPMPFDLVSTEQIGKIGEFYEGVVTTKTFRGDYQTRPDENGEVKKIAKVELSCFVVD